MSAFRTHSPPHPALLDPHDADLRRPRGPAAPRAARDLAETLVARAERLDPESRAIIRAVYLDGVKVKDLAACRGEPPRTLRRRVRSIARRTLDPTFAFVSLHTGPAAPAPWTPTRRKVASLVFLEGATLRDAAQRTGLTLHTVRRHAEAVRALAEAWPQPR